MPNMYFALLHSSHEGHGGIANFLIEHLGKFGEFIDSGILHSFYDTLKIIPFLFLTYLLMEFIEHKAGDKTIEFMKKSGSLGPLIGGTVGALPQCGFSSVASNLYTGRIITAGTLVAVFLSTSDEMLPLLISNSEIKTRTIIFILVYKIAVAIASGFAIDLALKLMKKDKPEINIDEICDNDDCHCEKGIVYSSIHHTLNIAVFILISSLIINSAIFFIGQDNLVRIMYNKPFISHLIAALFGLIPNCAASVALTEFYTSGFITLGTMLSGLFSGAGVGLLVLFRMNKHQKANAAIVGILVGIGIIFGLIADIDAIRALVS